jgi:hypothetical protein
MKFGSVATLLSVLLLPAARAPGPFTRLVISMPPCVGFALSRGAQVRVLRQPSEMHGSGTSYGLGVALLALALLTSRRDGDLEGSLSLGSQTNCRLSKVAYCPCSHANAGVRINSHSDQIGHRERDEAQRCF